MSQKAMETESGESLQLPGPGSDSLNATNSIKQLLSEVKQLYEQRLRCLELDTSMTQVELQQNKVISLQSYVNDLTDQNQLLLQTIEDLQNKADDKASSWEVKRLTSDGGLERTTLGQSLCYLCSKKKDLWSDLAQFIQQTGHMHNVEVFEADLKTLSLDDLVGRAAHFPHTHSSDSWVRIATDMEDLRIQLQTKDLITSELERELGENSQHNQETSTQVLQNSERLAHLQTEISCLQRIQRDNIKEIAEKDVRVTKLQAHVEQLQQEGADTQAQLTGLSARASELQEELRRKEEGWRHRENEQRLKHEKDHRKAEERRWREQQKREEEEWAKRVEEEKERDEEWKRVIEEEREAHAVAVKKWAEKTAILTSEAEAKMEALRGELHASFDRRMEEKETRISQLNEELNGARQKVKEREDHVRHLDQDVVGLRVTEDSLKRTLATKEKHMQQLLQDNTQLKESLAFLQNKLQTSDCMLSDIMESLDQTKAVLSAERQQREQIHDQLSHASKEVERLQQELTHVHHTTEKKIQKRELKMCVLLRELAERKEHDSECQNELLRRQMALEKLCEERDELRARVEGQGKECVHLNRTNEGLEADLTLCHENLHASHLEVRSRDELILQLRAEMKTAEKKHQRTQEQVAALEGEVRHLKEKVRQHREEACQLNEKVSVVECLKDQQEKEQQQLHDQLRNSQQRVETFEGKLKKQEAEMECLHRQLKESKQELNGANLQAQSHKDGAAIFKQKYTAAMEKVHKVQGKVELLQEELLYSQQQLRGSQLAADSVKEELDEMVKRYQNKVAQWENSQEALDQLTDDLLANQNLLRASQEKVECLQGLTGSIQQQKLTLERDLRLYKQSHSHSDEEHHSLLRERQQLQKSCTEQVERLAECEKAILQMKSELERQAQEKVGLKQSLIESHHKHTSDHNQMQQEVLRLKKEVTCLELQLAEEQKVHVALLRHSEEELSEARREASRRSGEVLAERGEVQRLRVELQEQEEEVRSATRQRQSLSSHIRRLSQELEELQSKHQLAVEELAARAEEARQMEGRLDEGKLAEGKIRSMAVRLETEAAELRRNLQQAVDHKLKAERERQDAQDQVDKLRLELEGTRSDNAKLRHESQLVVTNVNRWITEQKASNETLTAQMKGQNKVLLIVTEEKEYLQEANDTLKAEVKRLKEVADEKARVAERFKNCLQAERRDQGIRRDERTREKQGRVALNLSKIEDMQTKLRHNLEAIRMLNQQLNAVSAENKWLRGQLEEERSMRLLPPPPTSQHHSSFHPPFSLGARPPPPPTFLPSSLRLPRPLSRDPATGDADGILAHTELRSAVLGRPGESQASVGIRPTASACLEEASSRATSRDLTK